MNLLLLKITLKMSRDWRHGPSELATPCTATEGARLAAVVDTLAPASHFGRGCSAIGDAHAKLLLSGGLRWQLDQHILVSWKVEALTISVLRLSSVEHTESHLKTMRGIVQSRWCSTLELVMVSPLSDGILWTMLRWS